MSSDDNGRGDREYFMSARAEKARHQAHIARLMSHTLSLLMYQSEREHQAHPQQTELVMMLGKARDAADRLAEQICPDVEKNFTPPGEPVAAGSKRPDQIW